MPTPAKHPSARSRRNKASTAAELVRRDPAESVEIPPLPQRFRVIEVRDPETGKSVKDKHGQTVTKRLRARWHPQAMQMWAEVWSSEMVDEYLEADFGLIRALLLLEQEIGERAEDGRPLAATMEAAAKVRKELGLTPQGRRTLDWVIAQTDEARARTRSRRKPAIDSTAEEIPEAEVVEDTPEAENDEMGALYE